ncbi:MAG: Gfo/Idh/MocA family oxidoreductase [Sporichthyaceae bacterium]|nr:Gfo/Idh/MocA family oxidoreductase [Sporichthyaceae bacterium]
MTGFRWGVLGTGGIAGAFVRDLSLLPDTAIVAVGSRRQETADEFARAHGIPRALSTYQSLVSAEDVDAVYVATTHPAHHDAAMLAIEAGKAVLVEKPFTMDASEARSLVAAARHHGTFLMEAMWTRFLPHMIRLRELLAAGALGEVRSLVAEHGQWFPRDPSHRLFAPELGGGALLDLGIYPVSFASMVLGTPDRVTAVSDEAFTGVDATTSVVLQHSGGAHATLTTTLEAAGANRASVAGTEARVEIDPVWYAPTTMRLVARDGTVLEAFERREPPHEAKGLRHEAAEVARCVTEGRLESNVMPLDETVAIMATMDEIRRQAGLNSAR